MHLQLRVLGKTEFEKRLARVERRLRDSLAGIETRLVAIGRAQRTGMEAIKGMRQSRWLYPTEIMA